MNFEQNFSLLFDDVNIPEVFVSEYLTVASGDYVKIYLYCIFCSKHKIEIAPLDLSKKLSLPIETIEQGLKYWEENHALMKKGNAYIISDLKQIELNKLYTPKLSLSTEDAIKHISGEGGDTHETVRERLAFRALADAADRGADALRGGGGAAEQEPAPQLGRELAGLSGEEGLFRHLRRPEPPPPHPEGDRGRHRHGDCG